MTDEIKLVYATAEDMIHAFQQGVEQLDNTMQEMQSIANTLEDGALLGRGGEAFTDAIEQKVVAEQNLQRARTDAQRAATEAEGRANAAIAAANGEAQSIEIRAQAEAEALRLVSEQIAANPSLIQYLYVQNLSDNVQLVLVPSSSPFLFDFASLAESNPGFIAPQGQPDEPPPGS